MLRTVLLGLSLLAAVAPSGAHAQALGSVVDVVPAAYGQAGPERRLLIRGADLFEGQAIVTDARGEVQVVFVDDTRLVVGPNSQLVVASILLRNRESASSFVLNALGGTFRFITGNSPKDAYTINTPTGTLAVRGTEFDLHVAGVTGEAEVLLYGGGVILCPPGLRCASLTHRCDVGRLEPTREARVLGRGIAATQDDDYPYAFDQSSLADEFRVLNVRDCINPEVRVAERQGPPITPPGQDPDPPPPPPPDDPPPPVVEATGNKGLGNGGESDTEGPAEQDNPGNGHAYGRDK